MNIYFTIYIVLEILSIGINLAKDGEPREDHYNFMTTLIAAIINTFLLYMAIKEGF